MNELTPDGECETLQQVPSTGFLQWPAVSHGLLGKQGFLLRCNSELCYADEITCT